MPKPAVEGPNAWDALPDGVRSAWNIAAAGLTPADVVYARDLSYTSDEGVFTVKWEARTAAGPGRAAKKYTWTFLRSRQQFTCSVKAL